MAEADAKMERTAKIIWTVIAVLLLLTTIGAFGNNFWYGYYKETSETMHFFGWVGFAGFLYGLWKYAQDAPTNHLGRWGFILGPVLFTFVATGFKVFS